MDGTATRLLLVEDSPAHAKLMMVQLRSASPPPQVEWVQDGEAAVQRLCHPPIPDLILLDLKLPKLDGHEVLKRIKHDARLKRTPVVMVTTSARDEDIAVAYDHGVNAYLVKPMDFTKMRDMLTSATEFWGTWNHAPRRERPG